MKKCIITTLTAVALAACSSTPEQVTPSTSASEPMSAEQAFVASAGINVAGAANEVDRQGFNNATDVGLAAGMASDFGAVGLGLGVLGILASPGMGPEGYAHILTNIPAGVDPESRRQAYSEAVYRATGLNPKAQGYKRVNSPRNTNAVVFIKDGCPITKRNYYDRKCSMVFFGDAQKIKDAPKSSNTYVVVFNILGDFKNYKDIPTDEAFARRFVDQMPSELSLYIPPKKVNGQMQPAKLYRNGKETALQ